MLFYTAIGSCHNLWSFCAFTFLQVHTMGRLCLHAQVCARKCVQKCMFTRVSRVCERAFIVFKHCLVAVSVTDLSMSVCSEALSGTVHTVYIQTGCAGKKKVFSHARQWWHWHYENHVWLHLIITKSFDIAAVCSVFFFFLNVNVWFLRSALFLPQPFPTPIPTWCICTAGTLLVHWFVKTHRISSLIG